MKDAYFNEENEFVKMYRKIESNDEKVKELTINLIQKTINNPEEYCKLINAVNWLQVSEVNRNIDLLKTYFNMFMNICYYSKLKYGKILYGDDNLLEKAYIMEMLKK